MPTMKRPRIIRSPLQSAVRALWEDQWTVHDRLQPQPADFCTFTQDLATAGHASTVLGAFVCVCAIVSALSALALLAPLAKWGVLMLFRPSAREEMPKHAKRALGPYLWPTAFLNMCAVSGEGLSSAFVRGGLADTVHATGIPVLAPPSAGTDVILWLAQVTLTLDP